MIRIQKAKKCGYFVQYVAKNGQILAHSEILNSRAAAYKNAKAMAKNFGCSSFFVSDCTGDKPIKILI